MTTARIGYDAQGYMPDDKHMAPIARALLGLPPEAALRRLTCDEPQGSATWFAVYEAAPPLP